MVSAAEVLADQKFRLNDNYHLKAEFEFPSPEAEAPSVCPAVSAAKILARKTSGGPFPGLTSGVRIPKFGDRKRSLFLSMHGFRGCRNQGPIGLISDALTKKIARNTNLDSLRIFQ